MAYSFDGRRLTCMLIALVTCCIFIALSTRETVKLEGGGTITKVAKVIEGRTTHFIIHALLLLAVALAPRGARVSCVRPGPSAIYRPGALREVYCIACPGVRRACAPSPSLQRSASSSLCTLASLDGPVKMRRLGRSRDTVNEGSFAFGFLL